MMPPSLRRSSANDWIKQACGCGAHKGCGFDNRIGFRIDVVMAFWAVDAIGQWRPVLKPLGEFGAAICRASRKRNSSKKAKASSNPSK